MSELNVLNQVDDHQSDRSLIQENDYVIVEKVYDDRLLMGQVSKADNFKWSKKRIKLLSLVGGAFDEYYELDQKTGALVRTQLSHDELFEMVGQQSEFSQEDMPDGNGKDNRNLLDDRSSQQLDRNDIEAMKAEGLSGQQLVETIVENSTTFKDKTAFSQEKYLKKKKSKYFNLYKIRRPTSRLIIEMYHKLCPQKVLNMRVDTLSQMLSAANVRSGGNYMVFDNLTGLLSAAVLERLLGDGRQPDGWRSGTVIQLYGESGPSGTWRQNVEYLNMREPTRRLEGCLLSLPFKQALALLKAKPNEVNPQEDPAAIDTSTAPADVVPMDATEPAPTAAAEKFTEEESTAKAVDQSSGELNRDQQQAQKRPMMNREQQERRDAKRRKQDQQAERRGKRRLEEDQARLIMAERNVDGLLIIVRQEPWPIVNVLLEYLGPSMPFVLYCNVIEPLAELCVRLKAEEPSRCVNLKLSESWLRSFQVLPGRTRPSMNMSGSGGYLLSGIRVLT